MTKIRVLDLILYIPENDQARSAVPVFKLAPLGCGQTFVLVTSELSVLGISPEVLQRVLSQASKVKCVMAALSPPRLVAAWRVEVLFSSFSPHYCAWFSTLLQGRFFWWMWAPMRSSILPSIFSSMASVQPIHIGAGEPVIEGCWHDLFRDACLQIGLMSLDWFVDPLARFNFFHIFAVHWISQRWTTTKWFSSLHTFLSETGCSSSTTDDITTFFWFGWMWPFPFRRHAMYQGSRWICFLQTEEERVQTQISQETLWRQHLSPGSAWKGRIFSSYPGVGSSISPLWYISSW